MLDTKSAPCWTDLNATLIDKINILGIAQLSISENVWVQRVKYLDGGSIPSGWIFGKSIIDKSDPYK
jgi:hypothetical protein